MWVRAQHAHKELCVLEEAVFLGRIKKRSAPRAPHAIFMMQGAVEIEVQHGLAAALRSRETGRILVHSWVPFLARLDIDSDRQYFIKASGGPGIDRRGPDRQEENRALEA